MGRAQLVKKISKEQEQETQKIETQDEDVATIKLEETIAIELEEKKIEMEIMEIDKQVNDNGSTHAPKTDLVGQRSYEAFKVEGFEENELSTPAKPKVQKAPKPIGKPIVKPFGKQVATKSKPKELPKEILKEKKLPILPQHPESNLTNPFTYIEKIPLALLEDPKFATVVQEIVQLWQLEYRKRIYLETRTRNKIKENNDGYVKCLESMVEEWMMRYESEKLRQDNLQNLSKNQELLTILLQRFKS